ncbi:MAG: glycosyltransferase family 4 protein [Halobacteriales archaeon]|nr:glycosyltransferase family 4 protein [Halobacteriales archaeon]
MRILAATPYYSPEGGGLERYAHGILSRLAGRGHDVEAMAFTSQEVGKEERDGVRLRRLRPTLRAGNTPVGGFAAEFRSNIRRMRPDIVVVHTPVPSPAQAAARAARREGVPYAVTYHAGLLRGSSPILGAVAALDRWTLERRMLDGAAALVAVGPYVRDHALRRHGARTTIVPPGVDAAQFSPGPGGDGRTVLFVGPLSSSYRWKGVDVLWQAFAEVRRRVPGARLRIVGAGDRAAEFLGLAAKADGIEILGRVPDERMPDLYREAAVTVLPSLTDAESFGMVLAEANACGRPVVASDVGGIPDFVRDGDNGYLARPGDAAHLADRIVAVLEAPDAAAEMGRRGRARVVAEHDWEKLAERTEAVLASVG